MKLQKEIFLSFFLGFFFVSFYFRAKLDHLKRMRWRKTSTNERNWKTKTKRKFCFCCCFFSKKGRRILSIRMDMFEFIDNIVSAWNDFMILFFLDIILSMIKDNNVLSHFFHTKFLFIFFYFWVLLLFDL